MKLTPYFFLAIILTTLTGSKARADIFSLAGDWSSTSDPSTNWAYGTYLTTGDPSTFTTAEATNSGGSTENGWQLTTASSDPNIEKNLTGSDIEEAISDPVDWRAGTVSFGPFNGGAVARFTTTSAGIYDISTTFQTDQIRGSETSDGTTGYLYVNGVSISNTGVLQDPGSAQFGTAVTLTDNGVFLTGGETVDFLVGNGAFTTQVDATLTEVPEPSQYGGLVAVLALLAVGIRRGYFSRLRFSIA